MAHFVVMRSPVEASDPSREITRHAKDSLRQQLAQQYQVPHQYENKTCTDQDTDTSSANNAVPKP